MRIERIEIANNGGQFPKLFYALWAVIQFSIHSFFIFIQPFRMQEKQNWRFCFFIARDFQNSLCFHLNEISSTKTARRPNLW